MSTYVRLLCFLCILAIGSRISGQQLPTILKVDVENFVAYMDDGTDPAKLGKNPGKLTATPSNFANWVQFADVTAINGSPAKGVMVLRTTNIAMNPAAQPEQAIGDVIRNAIADFRWEFLKPDGTPIGSIYVVGLSGGSPSPGSPQGAAAGSGAIVGGTGPFMGARGTANSVATSQIRNTSQAEDPSMRRIHGGGTASFLFQVFPLFSPEIVVTSSGPSVFHANFREVSADDPAKPGEVLILYAKGLGPTTPATNFGEAFPKDQTAVVTSPVEVFVDAKASPAINQLGFPGMIDTYRVDFRVPEETAPGMVPIQLSAAWIKSAAVRIAIK